MLDTRLQRSLIAFLRIAIGWTFLYAGITQVFDPSWSAAGFLTHTKTFHFLFAGFAAPEALPLTNVLVSWGHLLIGLSLVFGLLTRVGGVLGTLLMLVYWLAHMDFPYVESPLNFLIDFHVVYAGALVYLMTRHAGQIAGLDRWLGELAFVREHAALRPLVA